MQAGVSKRLLADLVSRGVVRRLLRGVYVAIQCRTPFDCVWLR
ncbi:type IV toxin-antitoxin system AbiEi family antitoxin domain-containing protein [Nocardioides sp. B-3]|nr:type IV toxin-antitoxin system AbiEi family antitoxin domain-containing protein [Nocardioides sp. B-3]